MVGKQGVPLLISIAPWLALAASSSGGLAAPSGTSAIAGMVTDASGGAIAGAHVTIVHDETGIRLDTVTNGEGLDRVSTLVPGTYRVTVELDRFDPVLRAVTLQLGHTLAVDVTLQISKTSETFRRICMNVDAWVVAVGIPALLRQRHVVESAAAYLVMVAVILIDSGLLYGFFSVARRAEVIYAA